MPYTQHLPNLAPWAVAIMPGNYALHATDNCNGLITGKAESVEWAGDSPFMRESKTDLTLTCTGCGRKVGRQASKAIRENTVSTVEKTGGYGRNGRYRVVYYVLKADEEVEPSAEVPSDF